MIYANRVAEKTLNELEDMLHNARLAKEIKEGIVKEWEDKVKEVTEEQLKEKIDEVVELHNLFIMGDLYQLGDDLEQKGMKKKASEAREIGDIVRKNRFMPVIETYSEMMDEIRSYAEFVLDEGFGDEAVISKRNLIRIIDPFESDDLLNEDIYIDILDILKTFPFASYYLFRL